MKTIKLLILPVIIATFLLFPLFFSEAQTQPEGPKVLATDIWQIITRVTNWFFSIVLALATIMLIYAAYKYVTAAGIEANVKVALNTVIYALIGIAIAVLSKTIVEIIKGIITAPY